jgi:hypothetical protein
MIMNPYELIPFLDASQQEAAKEISPAEMRHVLTAVQAFHKQLLENPENGDFLEQLDAVANME